MEYSIELLAPRRFSAVLISRDFASISVACPGLMNAGMIGLDSPSQLEATMGACALANCEMIASREYPFDTPASRNSDVPLSGRYMPFHGDSATAQPCRKAHAFCSEVTPPRL